MLPMATMVAKRGAGDSGKNAQAATAAITLPPRIRPKMMVMTWHRYLEVEPREAMVPETIKRKGLPEGHNYSGR